MLTSFGFGEEGGFGGFSRTGAKKLCVGTVEPPLTADTQFLC